jgi:hypothetical protein
MGPPNYCSQDDARRLTTAPTTLYTRALAREGQDYACAIGLAGPLYWAGGGRGNCATREVLAVV